MKKQARVKFFEIGSMYEIVLQLNQFYLLEFSLKNSPSNFNLIPILTFHPSPRFPLSYVTEKKIDSTKSRDGERSIQSHRDGV